MLHRPSNRAARRLFAAYAAVVITGLMAAIALAPHGAG